jgi:hypothetical protein
MVVWRAETTGATRVATKVDQKVVWMAATMADAMVAE